MCYNEIGLFGRYIDIVVGPIANTIWKGLNECVCVCVCEREREREISSISSLILKLEMIVLAYLQVLMG